jgi:hypothetical protein
MPGGASPTAVLGTAVIGGLASKVQGGKFGHGFVSAGLGAALGGRIKTGNAVVNVVVAAVVGGTISKLTGGKFANGAQTWAFSAAMAQDWSTKPKAKPTITGSDKTAFVGGAADDTFGAGVVRAKYEKFISDPANAGKAEYFEWIDSKALSTYVEENNGRVTIVAHSYGADEAAHLIADGMQVYKFVSVDPVGWTRPSMQAIANNTVIWNNFDSTGNSGNFWNNAVATIGGSWNARPDGYATSHQVKNFDHVSICYLFCNP